jgi:PAS domain S-box-containing protein
LPLQGTIATLVESLHDGVMLLGMDEKVIYASEAYCRRVGFSLAELQAQDPGQRAHPEDHGPLKQALARALAHPGQTQELAYRCRTKAGRWLRMRLRGSYHPQGLPGLAEQPLILAALRDQTAEVEALHALAEQVEFHRTLVEHLNDGVLILDLQQRPLYVSPSYARMLGLEPAQVHEQSVAQRVHPDDLDAVKANFKVAVEGGLPIATDYRLQTPQGPRRLTGYCRYLPYGFPQYPQPCVLIVARDVGAEREAQRRLADAERLHRTVLERFDDVVALADGEARFTWVSPSVTRMLGFLPEALVGRVGFELAAQEDRLHLRQQFEAAKERGSEGREVEFRLRDAAGRLRVLAALAGPAGEGLPGEVLMRMRDVTQTRLSEEALLRAERLGLLSELLAGLSHELRNPLMAAGAYAELMEDSGQLAAEDRANVAAIRSQLARMNQALDQVMNAPLDPPAERILAAPLLEQALSQARRRFGPLAAGVHCSIANAPDCPPLNALPGRLQLALANVALNALQALPPGGRLSLEARPDEGGVRISVVDDGPGPGNGRLEALFDPYYTTRPTASGLGLTTAKRIVEGHGGRIWAQLGQPGLRVHAWLPAASEAS